ncbi:hypothetical protein B0H13DRAFT_2357906 [Mycena leptocephala]|nr:hypothetical protein B0H13DRAFT_2357906 [Mycena leptocephala]
MGASLPLPLSRPHRTTHNRPVPTSPTPLKSPPVTSNSQTPRLSTSLGIAVVCAWGMVHHNHPNPDPQYASASPALFRASSGIQCAGGGESADEFDVGGGGGGGGEGNLRRDCEVTARVQRAGGAGNLSRRKRQQRMWMLASGVSPAEAAPDMERLRG